MDAYVLIAVALALYATIAVAGHVTGVWRRLGVSFYGPLMLWRTLRGRDTIRRVAMAEAFWSRYTLAGAAVALAMMAAVFAFLLWTVAAAPDLPLSSSASEEIGPGLPTESPLATALYGGAGFAVAVLVHEMAHGVVIAWSKIRLESVGVMFLAIPLGAFVEPADEGLRNAAPETRMRIYSAGPATNMLFAVVCLVLLAAVIPEAEPREPGALVTSAAAGSPAELAGFGAWTEVTHVGSVQMSSAAELDGYVFDSPGAPVAVNLSFGGELAQVLLPQGVAITEVFNGPAVNARLRTGMIIKSLNDTVIHSSAELRSVVENSTHEHPVEITVLERGYDESFGRDWFVQNKSITNITLISKWLWFYTHYNWLNEDSYKNQSMLGIATAPFGARLIDVEHLTGLYSRPYEGADGPKDLADATVRLVALPFIGYSPVIPPATDLYEPAGLASFLPDDAYWVLVNLVYWCFWANAMLGLANAIPALPFDGGYLLRDAVRVGLTRPRRRLLGIEKVTHIRRMTDDGEERLAKTITYGMTVISLFVVVVLILQPVL